MRTLVFAALLSIAVVQNAAASCQLFTFWGLSDVFFWFCEAGDIAALLGIM